MQLAWRKVGPREPNHELIWLTVSIGGVALAAIWLGLGLPWPICWFHEVTGEPCATCGATRATIAFLHGHFWDAFRWNPLVFVGCVGVALFDCYAIVVLLTGRRCLRVIFSGGEKRVLRFSAVGVLLLNWAYLLAHSTMFNS